MTTIRDFMRRNYKHFNAATCVDAAEGWVKHLEKGGKMFLTLAGAMSTAELGISVAELIRKDKVHGICCTGANLEEDIFNLVAHEHYVRVPNYRDMRPEDEVALLEKHLCRVTDTCIPELEAMRKIEGRILKFWQKAADNGERYFPHEYIYQLLASKQLDSEYQIDPKDSWVLAAAEKNLPIFTPGWEDSTLGNVFTAFVMQGKIKSYDCLKAGPELMSAVANWYLEVTPKSPLGFFQIGGGIAGDFPICAVPMIQLDLEKPCELWGYFCQIGDSTTSYGSYSGANPREKITWSKIGVDTPNYMIESDATIVAPLIFNYVLGK